MGWNDAKNYAKSLGEKSGLFSKEKKQDEKLPLNARIGSLLNLQMNPFIRASTSGSLISVPQDASNIIKSVSRVNIDISGKLYRYYLATGDNGEKEVFLQLYVNATGEIQDAIFCEQLTRFIPETREDQDIFTGAAGYGLGERTYSLSKDQLLSIGFSESQVNEFTHPNGESVNYDREFGTVDDEFVPPFIGTETRLDDAMGINGIKQEVYFMAYRRILSSMNEYLLITTEVVQSKNGNSSDREIHVDFMVGIPLDLNNITIS